MKWAEISVTCPVASEDAVVECMNRHGCSGCASKPAQDTWDVVVVQGWLPLDGGLQERLQALREELTGVGACGLATPQDFSVREVEDTGWLDEWRKYHRPHAVGRRLWIAPLTDATKPPEGRIPVMIDPGMAFGTGSHPTTRLTLTYLDRLLQPGQTVADVGTGSGILAIAAAKLGASVVYASECDALPRQVAADNARRNRVAERVRIMGPQEFEGLCPPCDLVLCNIIAETIAELAPTLARILAPDGFLVCSGIVAERLTMALHALRNQRLMPIEIASEDVWRTVLLRNLRGPSS